MKMGISLCNEFSKIARISRSLHRLPTDIQRKAEVAYQRWKENPSLPGLRFKRVGDRVSVRVGRGYRALGTLVGDTVYWDWIGKHEEYDRRLK